MSEAERAQAERRYARLADQPFVTYQRRESGQAGFFGALKAVYERRELLGQLIRRELVGKYKDSALGLVWSLVRPLTQLFVYYWVMGKFLGGAYRPETGVGLRNFAIFIFAGLTLYGLFSETVTSMTSSIVANAGLIKKVYLPREIFPLSAAGAALVNFLIQLVILIIASLALGTLKFGPNLLYAVGGFLVIFIWALAIGLTLSAANVFMRDVQFLVDVVVMLLMWASPIVYSWTFVAQAFGSAGMDWVTDVYLANPITISVIGFQEAFWAIPSGGEMLPDLSLRMLIAGLFGVIALWLGQRYFAKRQANFAQEL